MYICLMYGITTSIELIKDLYMQFKNKNKQCI